MMLDGVTSFSRIKILQKHVNASVTVKVLDGVSCHVMAENWQHLKRKENLPFRRFLCVRIEIESC